MGIIMKGRPRTLYEGTLEFPPAPRRSVIQLWRLFRIWAVRTFLGACGAVWGCTPCCWKGRCWPC